LIGFHSIFLRNHQFNTNGPISGSGFFNTECFTTPVFETQNHAGYDTRRKKSDKLLKMAILVFAWTPAFFGLDKEDTDEDGMV